MKNHQSKILVVEDEQHIALGLKLHLEKEGHEVILAIDGEDGLRKWQDLSPDLVVLDIMMPKMNGLQVLKKIRETSPQLPILILSAKDATYDKVKALKEGVDDYLAKPFDAEELLLRIERLLLKKNWSEVSSAPSNEHKNSQLSYVQINGREVDFSNFQLSANKGEVVQLTEQEIKLLKVFVGNPNLTLSRRELLKMAWGYQEEVETRTLDNFIVRFRKYFESNPKKPQIFKSIRSVGYMFVTDENNAN